LPLVLRDYFLGGLIGSVAAAAINPVARSSRGYMALGIVAVLPFFLIASQRLVGSIGTWGVFEWILVPGLGVLFGIVAAHQFWTVRRGAVGTEGENGQ
jgi:hypothetical protein